MAHAAKADPTGWKWVAAGEVDDQGVVVGRTVHCQFGYVADGGRVQLGTVHGNLDLLIPADYVKDVRATVVRLGVGVQYYFARIIVKRQRRAVQYAPLFKVPHEKVREQFLTVSTM